MALENAVSERINAFDVPTFCQRNGVSVTTAYKAAKLGHLRISKIYGRALILAEDEAAFRERLAKGELVTPPAIRQAENEAKTRKPGDDSPPAKRGRKPRRLGSDALGAARKAPDLERL